MHRTSVLVKICWKPTSCRYPSLKPTAISHTPSQDVSCHTIINILANAADAAAAADVVVIVIVIIVFVGHQGDLFMQ